MSKFWQHSAKPAETQNVHKILALDTFQLTLVDEDFCQFEDMGSNITSSLYNLYGNPNLGK